MVLSRFFQRQQSATNGNKEGGLGGADVLDDVRPDPRQPQSTSNDDVTDLFRKKKTPIIATKKKADSDDHSSDDSDDNSNDDHSNENYDDEATFVTKDSDIKSIDRQTLPLRSGDNDDDVTVDTMTTIDVKNQIKNDFLNDVSGNISTGARPKRRNQMHPDGTSNNDSSSSSNSNEDDNNNNNDVNSDKVDSDAKQAATLPLPEESTTTTSKSDNKSKLQSAGKKASWSTAWFSSTTSSTAATKTKNNSDATTPSTTDTSSAVAVNEDDDDDEGDSEVVPQDNDDEPNCPSLMVGSNTDEEEDGDDATNHNPTKGAINKVLLPVAATAALAASTIAAPVAKKSGWGWKTLSSTVSSSSTTKTTSDVVATATSNDIISDSATDRSCDNSVDATELEQQPISSKHTTAAKNVPLSSSTHSQKAARSTTTAAATATAIPILSLFTSKRNTMKVSSDPEKDRSHNVGVDTVLSNKHGDQEADDVDDNSSDDGSHQDRDDEEADDSDDDSVENVASHGHGDEEAEAEADGVDDDDESSENGSYQHSVERDNDAGQNNSESNDKSVSGGESDNENSNDDESEDSEKVQPSQRKSNLIIPQPSTAKVVSHITDDDGNVEDNDNDVEDANNNATSVLTATPIAEPVTEKSGWGWKALSSTILSMASTESTSDLGTATASNGLVADKAAHSSCDESVEAMKLDQEVVSSNDTKDVELSSSSHSQKPVAFTASAAIPIFSLLTSKQKSTAKSSSNHDDVDVVDNDASDYIDDAESDDDSCGIGVPVDGSQQDVVEHEHIVGQNDSENEDFSDNNATNSEDESETREGMKGIQRSIDWVEPLPSTATAVTSVADDRDEEEGDDDGSSDESDEDCDGSNEKFSSNIQIEHHFSKSDGDHNSHNSEKNFDDENDHETGSAGDMDELSSSTSESEGDNWRVDHPHFSIAKSVAVETTESQFQHHTVSSINDFNCSEEIEKKHDESHKNSDESESCSDGSDRSVHDNVNWPSNKPEDDWNDVIVTHSETDNIGSILSESQNRTELLLDDKSSEASDNSSVEHHAVESDGTYSNSYNSETKMSNTLTPNGNEMEDITARRYSPSDDSERSSDCGSCSKPTERLDDELDSTVDSKAKANETVMESVMSEDESNSSSDSDTSMERAKKVLELWKETFENSSKKGDRATSRSASFSDDDDDEDEPTPEGDARIESKDNNRDGGKAPKRVWGWFAVKKAVQEGAKPDKDIEPVDSAIDATYGQTRTTAEKSTDDELESTAPSESIEKEVTNEKVDESASDKCALVANDIVPKQTSEKLQDQQGQKKGWWFGKKSSFDEPQAPVDPMQQKKELLDGDSSKSSLERSSNHSTESVTEPLLDVLMNLEDAERANKAKESGSNNFPRPNRKKKKAKNISTLLEGARKVSRHGDEVSVGTMNVKKRQNGRAAVISRSHDEFDEGDEFGPKSRPWETTLKKIPKRSYKPKSTRQNPPPLDEFNSFPSELEDLLKIDVFGNTDDFLYQGKVSANADKQLPSLQEDDESDGNDNSDAPRDDEANDAHEEKSGADAIGIVKTVDMNDFEEQLEAVDQETPQGLDFDDMWDNVSCDASIAIEFEREKRKKNHEKEKKRQRREQEKDEKINSAQRLRVFERRNEKEIATNEGSTKKTTDKQSKLSDALVDAIHKVFDDGSVNSAASSQDQSKDEANRLDYRSSNGSCGSLYLPGDDETEKSDNDDDNKEDSVGSGNQISKQGESRARQHASDDASDDGMTTVPGSKLQENKKRAKDKKHNQGVKITNNNRNKKGKKAVKRSEIDSSEMFLAEVERLKRPKVLTIAALKQEMIDRRGTSVNLVKKEYVNYRKKRNDRRKGSTDNELKPIDFGALSEQLKKKQADSQNDIFGKPSSSDSRDDSESTSKQHQRGGLGAKLSRWKASEGTSELDDLATVMDSTPHHTSLLGSAAAFAKTTISHLPEVAAPVMHDVQGMAQTAGKTLATAGTTALSVGHAVGGTAVSNVGSGLSHGAQAINSGIHTTTEVFGKGLHTVAHGLTSTLTTSEAHATDSKKESFQDADTNKPDDNFMFSANFSDDHLMTIQEGDDDDDDDHGLLASHHKNRNHHDTHSFDGGSFYNDDGDDDESRGSGLRDNHKRNFKMSSMIKAPKINLSIKNLVPKLPKRKGSSGNHGYGGM